jgi:hypothetical protein
MITLQQRTQIMLATLWRASAPLTVTGFSMLAVLALSALGLAIDPRVVTGAPVWLKPAKFAISISIYAFTLAWIFSFLDSWPKTRRVVGRITAFVMFLEMAIIALQAFRGTTSHFNGRTPVDLALGITMGVAIVTQTLSTIAVAAALWRQHVADVALGWALRLGMTMTIVGAFTGGLMTVPTEQQLAAARAGEGMTIAGAHTVGAPDGGPGMPGTGWSTEHGDLRAPHFLGLHALQALPIVAILLARRKVHDTLRVRMVAIAAASYVALFGILLTQALRGQSLLTPDVVTVTLVASWLLTTIAATVIATSAQTGWLFAVKPGKIAGA